MKAFILTISIVLLTGVSIAQSTPFHLKKGNPVWNNQQDQYMYPVEEFNEYFLMFSVSDLSQVKKITIELSIDQEGFNKIIFHRTFTKKDFVQNYKTGSNVRYSFGNLEIAAYQADVQVELAGKKIQNKITKSIAP